MWALVVVYPNNAGDEPAPEPARRVLREPDHHQPVKLQGVGPGSPDGIGAAARSSTAAPSPATARWRPTGTPASARDVVDPATGNADPLWAGNATIYDGAVISIYAGDTQQPGNNGFTASARAAPAPAIDRRLRPARWRPAGLPRQHQRHRRWSYRPARRPDHAGRRDLRQRLCPQPADHQQRGAEQRRRLRHHPHRHAGSAGRRTTTTTTFASPTTASSPTPARTWPAASGCSPAPNSYEVARQRHLRQLLGRVRRRHERTAAAARTARSTTTASTSTARTTKAAAS